MYPGVDSNHLDNVFFFFSTDYYLWCIQYILKKKKKIYNLIRKRFLCVTEKFFSFTFESVGKLEDIKSFCSAEFNSSMWKVANSRCRGQNPSSPRCSPRCSSPWQQPPLSPLPPLSFANGAVPSSLFAATFDKKWKKRRWLHLNVSSLQFISLLIFSSPSTQLHCGLTEVAVLVTQHLVRPLCGIKITHIRSNTEHLS